MRWATVVLDEKHMDASRTVGERTGVYLHYFGIAGGGWSEGGLPRDVATLLAAQTTMGAARWCWNGDHPALLKDAVTTPAGCTIDGIMELEEGKLRVTLIKAV